MLRVGEGEAADVVTLPPLEAEIRDVVDRVAAVYGVDPPVVSVDCRPLTGEPPYLQRNARHVHLAASLMKLGVLVELARQVERGAVSLDANLLLHNSFPSVTGAGDYSLDAPEDSDPHLYRWLGHRVGVRVLVDRMIGWSSNLATNTLLQLLDLDSLHAGLASLGAADLRVPRGIEDRAAVDAGLATLVTAADLSTVLVAIARHEAAGPTLCEWMRGVLARQVWDQEVPAGLPPESLVGNKTGWLASAPGGAVQHDAALVEPPDGPGFALTVCTTGIRDSYVRRRVIRDVAAAAYRHVPRFAS